MAKHPTAPKPTAVSQEDWSVLMTAVREIASNPDKLSLRDLQELERPCPSWRPWCGGCRRS
jgi:hypothetical protein